MRQIFNHEYVGQVIYESFFNTELQIHDYRSVGRVSVAWEGIALDKLVFDIEDGNRVQDSHRLFLEKDLALTNLNPSNRRQMLK
jgi:hypothetical protein